MSWSKSIVVLWALSAMPLSAATELPVVSPAGDAEAGAQVAGVCAACHALDGNSIDPQYPKLAGQHAQYIARQLRLYASGERDNAIMLGFAAQLSEDDIRNVSAFYQAQQLQRGVADESVLERGKRLYAWGDLGSGLPSCAGCHGPAGLGNPASGYPVISGQHADYLAARLRAFRDGEVWGKDGNANAVMSGVAARLTDEQITALSSYLEGLHPVQP